METPFTILAGGLLLALCVHVEQLPEQLTAKHAHLPLPQCPMPANCLTALPNKCDGCSTCGFGYQRVNHQCQPCTGGQAPNVCTTYANQGTASCECTVCVRNWRPDNGVCVQVGQPLAARCVTWGSAVASAAAS